MTTVRNPEDDARLDRRFPLAEAAYASIDLGGLILRRDVGWMGNLLWEGGKIGCSWTRRLHVIDPKRPDYVFAVHFLVEWGGSDDCEILRTDLSRAIAPRGSKASRLP